MTAWRSLGQREAFIEKLCVVVALWRHHPARAAARRRRPPRGDTAAAAPPERSSCSSSTVPRITCDGLERLVITRLDWTVIDRLGAGVLTATTTAGLYRAITVCATARGRW